MEYHFLEIGITYLLGIAMPGPTIALVIKNSIIYSRKSAIISCLGIMLGISLQSGIVLTGLILLKPYIYFTKILRLLSSLYLIYLGIKIFINYKNKLKEKLLLPSLNLQKKFCYSRNNVHKNSTIKKSTYFIEALLLELLNPLALSFFISVLSIMTNYEDSLNIKFLYWLEIIIIGFLWFCSVAFVCSSQKINKYFKSINKFIEPLVGLVFLYFGIKILINI